MRSNILDSPQPIIAELDFPTPIADRVILSHTIGKLVERALKSPRRTGWRVHTVRARAALEQGASWLCEITLKDPSADQHRIAAPLRTRLEQMPPAGAVERLAPGAPRPTCSRAAGAGPPCPPSCATSWASPTSIRSPTTCFWAGS